MYRIAAVACVLLLSCGCIFAQTASVTGLITDPAKASLPGVKVDLTNSGTSLEYRGVTDQAGTYRVTNLPAGNYRIAVEKEGFKTISQSDITLHVYDALELDFELTVGSRTETVTVQAENAGVQLTTSSINAIVDSTTVRELPLNGRDWTQLATLQPGVVSDESEQDPTITVQRGLRGYGAQLSISGNRPQQNDYRLDGISINDYSNSGPGSVTGGALGVDAIQEFSVQTSNYSAEFGRTSGGVISAISRSGANQLHGSGYEFLRNSALDARNYFDPPKIPEFRRNQFGASIGGPIRKDRTFFFVDYEGLRQSLGLTQISDVLSPDARNGTIHNTDGSITNVAIDPSVVPFLAVFPLPNGPLLAPGNTGIYSFVANQVTSENFVTARIDHRISVKDSLFGSYQFDKSQISLPDAFNTVLYGSATGRQFVTIQESHIFSPQLLNNVRFGFNRYSGQDIQFLKALSPVATDPSFAAVPGKFAPELSVPGLTLYTGGIGSNSYERLYFNSFQGYDDLYFTKGKHSIKLGFNVERLQDNNFEDAVGGGWFFFGSLQDFLTNQSNYFLTSLPSPLDPRHLRQTIYGGYVQDDVRLRPSLTVNLGLRYEMATVITETDGRLSSLPSITALTPHLGSPLYANPTRRNFEPRVGLAWDPFGNGKTSIRAGFGMFDVLPLHYEFELPELITYPWDALETSIPPPVGSFPGGAFSTLNLGNVTQSYVNPHPKRNYVMQWNLSIQRQLSPSVVATVAYVGSRGNHDSFTEDNANWVYPMARTPRGYIWPVPGTGTLINPAHGRIDGLDWTSNNSYNALEAQVEKRMSHGLQIQGNYTWGKSIDEGSTSIAGDQFANSILNLFPFDAKLRRALADYNIEHNLTINFTWIVPSAKSLSGPAAWALNGWQLGGILQAHTGLPFTPQFGGDPLGESTGDGIDFPDRVRSSGCNSPVNPRSPNNYLKLDCFTLPMATPAIASLCVPFSGATTPGTCANLLGNSGRNSVIGPGLVTFDFSVFKNNYIRRISERFNVQFRAEVFNLFNRANFAPPTNNQALFDPTGAPVAGAGRIDATSTTAREIQFAVKVIF
jgi:hypothetical protein